MDKKMDEVQVLEAPVKSESDKKEYRLIKLSNGLKAILIKEFVDEQSQSKDIAAASLSVKVGSFDDPPHVMGLAHFLEHILFMGSTKYPVENSFNDFLTANSGSDNAMTGSEETKYFFKVAEKAFPEALDIFANQFISPLLLKNSMQREREAVDSEFRMAFSSDVVMQDNIYKSMIFENHPASQFECGNLKTLKDDITDDNLHAELLQLHSKYVGNKMCLAVQSSRSLDDLQDLVVKCFSPLQRGDDNVPSKPLSSVEEVFKPDFFNKLYFVKPKSSKKSLSLAWALPPVLQFYKCSPVDYIDKIFENEGNGGLESYLKEANLITSTSFYNGGTSSFSGNFLFCMPKFSVHLTDHGLQNIESVLEAIFSYLLMIKETPIDEHRRLFNEHKEMQEIKWKFSTSSSAVSNVQLLSSALTLYEDRDILLSGSRKFIEFDEKIISSTIEALNQGKFNILISDSDREIYTKKDKFFGTDYDEQEVPEAYRKLWNERQLKPEFFLEKPNIFRASNFEIFVNEEESPVSFKIFKILGKSIKFNLHSKKYPVKVFSDEIYEVWHKLDNKHDKPEAYVYINFMSPNLMKSIHK